MGKGLLGSATAGLEGPIQELLEHMKTIAEKSERMVEQNDEIIELLKRKQVIRTTAAPLVGTELVDAIGKPHPDVVEVTSPIQAGTLSVPIAETFKGEGGL